MIRHHRSGKERPARVVILGGSGFVGRALARHLQQANVETVALSSVHLDLCDPGAVDALREVVAPGDALVMAAALTPDRGRDIAAVMRNLAMAQHLAAFLAGARCTHVVYLSSDAVYDDGVCPIRETSPACPGTLYGQMHRMREQMIASVLDPKQCPLLVLRPCAVYGAGDTHNSYGPNRFLRSALKEGRITLFGNGEEKRDHVHVDDLCRLIGLALARQSAGVLNVATGKAMSFRDVAERLARLCGEVRIETTERRVPITHRHFDISECIRAFPTFSFTPLAEGLAALHAAAGGTEHPLQEVRAG
jgi:nucleoside-diphosphate-sugar epimerase